MNNRFEFLGSISLGQYIPRVSLFHQRDPRARLLTFFVLLVGILFTPNIFGLLIGFMAITLIYIFGQLPLEPAWRAIRRALPFIFVLAILQIVFSIHGEGETTFLTFWELDITQEDLRQALMLILRFII